MLWLKVLVAALTVAFSVALGYDKLTVNMVLGGVIILISILMTELKLPKKKGSNSPEAELLFEEEQK